MPSRMSHGIVTLTHDWKRVPVEPTPFQFHMLAALDVQYGLVMERVLDGDGSDSPEEAMYSELTRILQIGLPPGQMIRLALHKEGADK